MEKLFFTLLTVLVIGSTLAFAGTEIDPSAKEAAIVIEGIRATYSGSISDGNVERFLDAVKGKEIAELVISSGGGDINAGMALGEWVFDNRVDVVVEGMCMSSCANYVFTAARRKTIRDNAVVAWHGSVLQKTGMSDEDAREAMTEAYSALPADDQEKYDLEELVSQAVEQMKEYRENATVRQEAFFNKIGVDEYICRVGIEEYGAESFFLLSVEDMARFGVLDVHAPENYRDTDLEPLRGKGRSVEFVTLH